MRLSSPSTLVERNCFAMCEHERSPTLTSLMSWTSSSGEASLLVAGEAAVDAGRDVAARL
jgi:hypothetical protein